MGLEGVGSWVWGFFRGLETISWYKGLGFRVLGFRVFFGGLETISWHKGSRHACRGFHPGCGSVVQ